MISILKEHGAIHTSVIASRTECALWAKETRGQILVAAIAVKIILLFVLAWNSRFVMDEFWQLGNAKYVFDGFFDTIQPGKAVGHAFFSKLAFLIGWDAQSILLAGRLQTALLGCVTIVMTYACARALGDDRARSLTIVLILLCFSNFMERLFRTRTEPLALFFAVAALLTIVRCGTTKPRHIFLAGVLSGLAFTATQKSVYFNIALGLALVVDAGIARRYADSILRGALLVLGWTVPIIGYCFLFGGSNPLPVAQNLLISPVDVAMRGTTEYIGLRRYVFQTISRNSVLYVFCFAGMLLALMRITALEERKRIALIFSAVITVLVFAHDQPWPYVFIMALPFMSLWSLGLIDRISDPAHLRLAWIALITAMGVSYATNLLYLRIDNAGQRDLLARAEAIVGPEDHYFDGTGMLPNRRESTPLWLDRRRVVRTLQDGEASVAYQGLNRTPPKAILWSYRMNGIYPTVAPIIRDSYVRISPNIRMAGRRLFRGAQAKFIVPVSGNYGLYTEAGEPVSGRIEVDGKFRKFPLHLNAGTQVNVLHPGPSPVLMLPEGSYRGIMAPGIDEDIFANVYS